MTSGRPESAPQPDSGTEVGPTVVHSITGARQGHTEDMDLRIRRYLISMGIRTACVILVLVLHGPVRWLFAVLAVVLPYIAVVMANVAGGRRKTQVSAVTPVPLTPIHAVTVTTGHQMSAEQCSERGNSDSEGRTA